MLDRWNIRLRSLTPLGLAGGLFAVACVVMLLRLAVWDMGTNCASEPPSCTCNCHCPLTFSEKAVVKEEVDSETAEGTAEATEGDSSTTGQSPFKRGEPQVTEDSVYEQGDLEEITETGAWKFNESYVYHFDSKLADYLGSIIAGKTVLELGAGRGHYTHHFAKTAKEINAYDGAIGIEKLTGGYVKQADLTNRLTLGTHDWVICMEVGEHVPKEYELSVIDNIHRHNREGVILSWAVLGQPGKGHVNTHSNGYVKNVMNVLGYDSDNEAERKARNITTLWWFENSIMIFRRKEYPDE